MTLTWKNNKRNNKPLINHRGVRDALVGDQCIAVGVQAPGRCQAADWPSSEVRTGGRRFSRPNLRNNDCCLSLQAVPVRAKSAFPPGEDKATIDFVCSALDLRFRGLK